MVGDSESDIRGGKNAGWATQRYTGGGFGDVPDGIDWGLARPESRVGYSRTGRTHRAFLGERGSGALLSRRAVHRA